MYKVKQIAGPGQLAVVVVENEVGCCGRATIKV